MKKSLLITTSILAAGLVTGIYAQSVGATGGSIIEKMKAAAHSFTLGSILNPTESLTSDPVKGKKTGDILTAGEWNRVLELISEGGTGGAGTGWENVPLTDTTDYDTSCLYRYFANYIVNDANRKWMNSTSAIVYIEAVSPKYLRRDLDLANDVMWGVQSSNKSQYGNRNTSGVFTPANNIQITRMEKLCGGVGGNGSGWVDVPLTDTADYDTTCLYEVKVKTTAAIHDNLMNGDTSWRIASARTNKYLGLAFTDGSATTYASWGVPSSTKSTYGYRDSAGTFAPSSGVSILGMRKLCGGGSGSGGPALYKCTNAQSLDATNAPCYGASRNGGAGTDRYRVVSCSNTDASGTYTAGGLLNFGTFMANKWSFHINNSNIACTDGSVLVMDIQGGGSGVGVSSGWVDVPLTDTADFDDMCQYRFLSSGGIPETYAGTNYWVYPLTIDSKHIVTNSDNGSFGHVYSSSKTAYRNNGSQVLTIQKMQKLCGGGGGSSSNSGWSDIGLTGNIPFDINCEYRFKASAPGNTDDDAYIGDDNAYNYIQRVHANRLTYQHIGSSYEHINADTKTTLRQNGTPTSPSQTITQIQERCN